ncbi:hypothetical protein O9929_01410 [Vibrio lentus]|nr:hypothetical protein [Vibrio lentus]
MTISLWKLRLQILLRQRACYRSFKRGQRVSTSACSCCYPTNQKANLDASKLNQENEFLDLVSGPLHLVRRMPLHDDQIRYKSIVIS